MRNGDATLRFTGLAVKSLLFVGALFAVAPTEIRVPTVLCCAIAVIALIICRAVKARRATVLGLFATQCAFGLLSFALFTSYAGLVNVQRVRVLVEVADAVTMKRVPHAAVRIVNTHHDLEAVSSLDNSQDRCLSCEAFIEKSYSLAGVTRRVECVGCTLVIRCEGYCSREFDVSDSVRDAVLQGKDRIHASITLMPCDEATQSDVPEIRSEAAELLGLP